VRLAISISETELVSLVRELAPIRIHFGASEEVEQWVELAQPEHRGLVRHEGFRLETQGTLRLNVAGLPITIGIERLQLLIQPRIDVVTSSEPPSSALVFDIQVEQGDLKRIPSLIEKAVLKAVNDRLIPENTKTLWRFPETFTKAFPMPKLLEPLEHFVIRSGNASVEATDEYLTFEAEVDTSLERSRNSPVND